MIEQFSTETFLNAVDPHKLWVYQPSAVILVCGGPTAIEVEKAPPSLRECFLRYCIDAPFDKYEFLLAETLTANFEPKNYRDILSFEAQIAEICSLVLLFSESYGSAAELGAFAMKEPIAEKLLAIVDDENYREDSFIKLGPLKLLQNNHGEASVCVLNRGDVGITSIQELESINRKAFFALMKDATAERLRTIKQHQRFSAARPGDVIKLIVGLIQWYGALTVDEVEVCLTYFDISMARPEIENFLHCSNLIGWTVSEKRGSRTYFAARANRAAIKLTAKEGRSLPDPIRWQAVARDEWKMIDAIRFNFISEVTAGGAN